MCDTKPNLADKKTNFFCIFINTKMNDTKINEDNWKIFRRDTNAGRLLSRLYGESPQGLSNRVNYPKLKVRKVSDLKSRPRFNTITKSSDVDPDVVKRKQKVAALCIPKVGRIKGIEQSKFSTLPKLKTLDMCQVDIDRCKQYNKTYRPPHSKNLDDEKLKLCKAFENNGDALPDMPHHSCDAQSTLEDQENLDPKPITTVQQIVAEIEERRDFQKKMEENGVGFQSRERICAEIATRMEELMMHDKHLALEMMGRS
jgi:hypothetical protein